MPYYRFDLFISYRQRSEGPFVRDVLVPRLDAEGIQAFVDYRNFELGAALVDEMSRGVELSRYTLAIVSRAYLESTFADFENVLAQHLGLEDAARRLIVAVREKCDLPLRLRAFLYLEWSTQEGWQADFPRLLIELRKPGT